MPAASGPSAHEPPALCLSPAPRDDTTSVGVRPLTDLLDVFRHGGDLVPALATETILAKLHQLDEASWRDWYVHSFSARDLAKLLKPFGVRPGTVRIGDETAEGYQRSDLWDPGTRYGVLASVSDTSVTSVTPLTSTVTDVTDVSDNRTEAMKHGLLPVSPVPSPVGGVEVG